MVRISLLLYIQICYIMVKFTFACTDELKWESFQYELKNSKSLHLASVLSVL